MIAPAWTAPCDQQHGECTLGFSGNSWLLEIKELRYPPYSTCLNLAGQSTPGDHHLLGQALSERPGPKQWHDIPWLVVCSQNRLQKTGIAETKNNLSRFA
jgi:hypothetical protein